MLWWFLGNINVSLCEPFSSLSCIKHFSPVQSDAAALSLGLEFYHVYSYLGDNWKNDVYSGVGVPFWKIPIPDVYEFII